ncbi:kinase-like domain-containing protein [Syncephalis plumigaleata]|nr:kinase-like domain-containing protein [Syncephalis plumigaleata]
MAKAAYRENGKDVGAVIKCVNHQARDKKAAQALISRISNELSAYRIIKGNENGYNGELKQGQNYISRFLGQVMEGQWQCILTTEANGPNLLDYFTNLKVLNDRIERGFLFLKQVAMGMAYLNAIGIAQRDVKPENILVDITNPNNPAAMITNFDAALIRSPQELCRVLSTERVGTPLYNPPELYRCAAASTKVSTMQRIKGMFGGGNNNPNSCTIQEYNTCTKDVGSLGMSFINSVIGHPVIYPMETPRFQR